MLFLHHRPQNSCKKKHELLRNEYFKKTCKKKAEMQKKAAKKQGGVI